MRYAIVDKAVVTIYDSPCEVKCADGLELSAISDEALYGMGLRITGEAVQGYLPVTTFYGYTGFVSCCDVTEVSLEALQSWEAGLAVTAAFCLDVMSVPKVQGVKYLSLFAGSLLYLEAWESEKEGWARVRLIDGRFGYVRNQYLEKKEFSQSGLWTEKLPQKKIVDEASFRKAVVDTARTYLGTQYRWGGRSTAGIDCSGLTSASYMRNGILTWRDAKIVEGYPVHEISRDEMMPGDLLYFPGHIGMYMGNGKYIHSTGKIGSGGVVVNSFNPSDSDYRADLVESLYAVGSIFPQ